MSESRGDLAGADLDESARALGARIRTLRQQRKLTLTQAAAEADLSHSFLSQVERGIERLSMASLFRIARALGTTQQDLLTDEPPERTGTAGGDVQVYRKQPSSPVDAGTGPVSVLAAHRARFLPMIFEGAFDDDGIWWEHEEEEFLFVLAGEIIVVLPDREIHLETGDSAFYESNVRHKWRTPEGMSCRVLVVKEQQHTR